MGTQVTQPVADDSSPSNALVALRRRPARPEIEPYQQGDLDGLCGLYAVINALRLLHPRLDDDGARAMFRKLTKTLGKTLAHAVWPVYDGIHRVILEDLLIAAREHAQRHLGLSIEVEPLILWRKHPTLSDLWDGLREHLDGRQVAILGLEGAKDHWTVAYAATETTIRLFDSSDRHLLTRSRCTLQRTDTRVRLRPKAVLLIKRKW